MIETRGAPYVQGWDQGRALAERIREDLSRARGELGRWAWRRAIRAFRRGPGRATGRFLPQHQERLAGIAAGAGRSTEALGLLSASCRIRAAAGIGPRGIEAWIPMPPALEPRLLLRRSVPDVGGFPSVELTWAPSAGCLAGVNSEGLAVVCERDEDPGAPSAGLLAQELLFRVRELASAAEHARRRGAFIGGVWSLVLMDRSGAAVRVVCGPDGIRASEEVGDKPEGEGARVEVRAAERAVCLIGRAGSEGRGGVLEARLE